MYLEQFHLNYNQKLINPNKHYHHLNNDHYHIQYMK